MWELVKSGGWMMLPIILCSIAAAGIIAERLWTLRPSRITPPHLLGQVWMWIKEKKLTNDKLKELRANSPLGQILAAGLANSKHGREIMKECIEEAAARVVHELERYLNALGTIAGIAPLLGLLGTVLGISKVFRVIATQAVANPALLANGIWEALTTTIIGLAITVPVLCLFYFFRMQITGFQVELMEYAGRFSAAMESR